MITAHDGYGGADSEDGEDSEDAESARAAHPDPVWNSTRTAQSPSSPADAETAPYATVRLSIIDSRSALICGSSADVATLNTAGPDGVSITTATISTTS